MGKGLAVGIWALLCPVETEGLYFSWLRNAERTLPARNSKRQ